MNPYSVNPIGLMEAMFAHADALNKKQKRIDAGITEVNGLEGIEKLNIPHKYDMIDMEGGYFHCRAAGVTTVYNKDGKHLLQGTHVKYCKQNMFLVGDETEKIKDKIGYSLYHNETKLTDAVFTPYSDGFTDYGFAVVGFNDYTNAVINRKGEVLLKTESFDHPYLHGVVCSDRKNYTNLLTGGVICEKGYNTIYSTEFIFTKVEENCVYQINQNTGEFMVHGQVPKPKEPPKPYVRTVPQPIVNEKKPGRNDVCTCGSGKKFKNCCLKLLK